MFMTYQKKNPSERMGSKHVGIALSSQAVTRQVFSTLMSLTSVFGMGTGGSSSPVTPTISEQQVVLYTPYGDALTLNKN